VDWIVGKRLSPLGWEKKGCLNPYPKPWLGGPGLLEGLEF